MMPPDTHLHRRITHLEAENKSLRQRLRPRRTLTEAEVKQAEANQALLAQELHQWRRSKG